MENSAVSSCLDASPNTVSSLGGKENVHVIDVISEDASGILVNDAPGSAKLVAKYKDRLGVLGERRCYTLGGGFRPRRPVSAKARLSSDNASRTIKSANTRAGFKGHDPCEIRTKSTFGDSYDRRSLMNKVLCNHHRNSDRRSKVRPASAQPLISSRHSSTPRSHDCSRLKTTPGNSSHMGSFSESRYGGYSQDREGFKSRNSHSQVSFPVSHPQNPKNSKTAFRSQSFGTNVNGYGNRRQPGKFTSQSFCDVGGKKKSVVYVAVPSAVY